MGGLDCGVSFTTAMTLLADLLKDFKQEYMNSLSHYMVLGCQQWQGSMQS